MSTRFNWPVYLCECDPDRRRCVSTFASNGYRILLRSRRFLEWTGRGRRTRSLVNVARFSYNRFNETIAPVDANVNPTQYGLNTGITDPRLFGFPEINPSTYYFNYLGGNSSWPLQTSPSHTENYSDTVSYTVGKHALRFGGDFSNGGVDYYRAGYGRGGINFHHLG